MIQIQIIKWSLTYHSVKMYLEQTVFVIFIYPAIICINFRSYTNLVMVIIICK